MAAESARLRHHNRKADCWGNKRCLAPGRGLHDSLHPGDSDSVWQRLPRPPAWLKYLAAGEGGREEGSGGGGGLLRGGAGGLRPGLEDGPVKILHHPEHPQNLTLI